MSEYKLMNLSISGSRRTKWRVDNKTFREGVNYKTWDILKVGSECKCPYKIIILIVVDLLPVDFFMDDFDKHTLRKFISIVILEIPGSAYRRFVLSLRNIWYGPCPMWEPLELDCYCTELAFSGCEISEWTHSAHRGHTRREIMHWTNCLPKCWTLWQIRNMPEI